MLIRLYLRIYSVNENRYVKNVPFKKIHNLIRNIFLVPNNLEEFPKVAPKMKH